MLPSRRRFRALLTCGLSAAAAGFLTSAPASQAAGLSGSACSPGPATQAFLPWGDANSYTLVPGGDFENGASGWSLQGGAGQVPGSELYGVTGTVGESSLGLPSGAVAVSPLACVNVPKPTVELFTRTSSPGAEVTVSLLYTNNGGNVVVSPFATISPTASWQPTGPLQLPTVSAPGHAGSSGYVALELSEAGGPAQVDDVHIDPWASW